MEQRVNGLEIEFAMGFESPAGMQMDPGAIFNHVEKLLTNPAQFRALKSNSFGRTRQPQAAAIEIKEGYFLESGARFYYDTGHIEWATPEALNAHETALYDLAGTHTLAAAARQIKPPRGAGHVLVTKNNVDYVRGKTYGCHENYQAMRALPGLSSDGTFERYVHVLTAFLVTRQIYAGAGKVGCADLYQGREVGFQISQRADFITRKTSNDTRGERAIIDERDETLGDERRGRRLHLIVGDSNMSEYANVLKIGTTLIVLRLLEDGALQDVPQLADPIAALKAVSYDLTCMARLPLRGGGQLSAIEIQRYYLQQAQRYFANRSPDAETVKIMAMWQETLDDLAADPRRLADRLDWAAKWAYLMQPRLDAQGCDWPTAAAWSYIIRDLESRNALGGETLDEQSTVAYQRILSNYRLSRSDFGGQRRLYYDLRARDLRYHDIDPSRGLYEVLCQEGLMRRLFDAQAIERAKTQPPRSRAFLRAQIIGWAHENGHADTATVDWGRADFDHIQQPILLLNPLETANAKVEQLLRGQLGKPGGLKESINRFFRRGSE